MDWLSILATWSLWIGVGCFFIILWDIVRRPQHMWIMNIVWPITGLYSGLLGVWAYYRIGTLSSHQTMHRAMEEKRPPLAKIKPFWQSVLVSATHCGSGCTLGDIIAEWFIFFVPLTLLGKTMFAAWVIDYILAFLFGIAFQYFTIKSMKKLSTYGGFKAALKADTLSLTSWQIGMFGWMALSVFVFFHHELSKTEPMFWFMMQIAMLAGFLVSYPVNWWLLTNGVKERM